tara:strand:+ start:119 stop:571 length:453 start_codon:yes stop_codon:yes gene_type:complete
MPINCRNTLGIELRNNSVSLCKIDDQQCIPFFYTKKIKFPNMPGAVIIYLSELISFIDSESPSFIICIGLKAVLNSSKRIVLLSSDMPNWNDVPLCDWLEIQTGKKVILENLQNCAHQAYSWGQAENSQLNQKNTYAYGAALLALASTSH